MYGKWLDIKRRFQQFVNNVDNLVWYLKKMVTQLWEVGGHGSLMNEEAIVSKLDLQNIRIIGLNWNTESRDFSCESRPGAAQGSLFSFTKSSLNFIQLPRAVFSFQQHLNRPAINAVQWHQYYPKTGLWFWLVDCLNIRIIMYSYEKL